MLLRITASFRLFEGFTGVANGCLRNICPSFLGRFGERMPLRPKFSYCRDRVDSDLAPPLGLVAVAVIFSAELRNRSKALICPLPPIDRSAIVR
jgi:hypothetical protein